MNETFSIIQNRPIESILNVNGTLSVHGWSWSYTESLFTVVIIGLIIWNIYLSFKLWRKRQ